MDIWPRQLQGAGSRESLARLFGDLSHPLRLAIVIRLLSVEKECVCSLAHSCRADQPTLSRHLRILKDHGVVADRREGAKVFYQVVDPRASAILNCSKIVGPDQGRTRLKQEGP
ncbi:MAG: metalloregulator ArsR/SmtB family transcription factor [Acidobacteriota bacterium]